ncbi:bifunctional 3-dehydroquinate dehydratase/shikimate dehydrogenase, chloroplastic-like isoform X2 [Andrographis paniculata]|uniref:bifunctional 3-dehydroquinate dehydratase/shikimate dehydrogenase, chloroplastic-like isoform X2 n=1 Tax=Andrographis paniculata TaxID=175694 RepID=UPI0021E9443D|nr:bifunctional 3-dehydroquinate dehydratase/shikimate dehydrogenase, chloroplastic-like isoform X2 [Andrographis paniculata]
MGLRIDDLVVCAPLECESTEEMVKCMESAKKQGADIVHLCIDLPHISDLQHLLSLRTLPSIVSFRNSEQLGVQVLKRAVELDIEYVDIDYEVCSKEVIAELRRERSRSSSRTRIIVSNHVQAGNVTREKLGEMIIEMQSTEADVIKLVIDVGSITDVAPIFHMLTHCQVPLIARATGERGLISQLLGPKYGAFMVWGSLGEKSVPGLPPLSSIKQVYRLENVNADTKIFGVVSNPVGHSKGPLLHNPAFRYTGYNGIYVPLLVDDVKEFFRVYSCNDFAGFSVGIPHKETALSCCDEVHPLALGIGAVNTIVRRPSDGKLVGYNTDCEACITAIEDAYRARCVLNGQEQSVSPLAGKLLVLVGAGGAGRAIAFGAWSRGARVVIFNRNFERAKALAAAVSGEALPYESLNDFRPENGMILANASAVGMEPKADRTPVSKAALRSYELVFDAVYTPRNTRLLREAAEVGATVVHGVEMFIRQALGQFKLFTGGLAPEDFMRKIVLEQF